MTEAPTLTLNEKILIAAFDLQSKELKNTFSAEQLLIAVWKQDKGAFGLRNFEQDYPDSNKLYTKIDGQDGLVRKGLLKKVADRTYSLTAAGLSLALSLKPSDAGTQLKVDRELYEGIKKVINHKVFGEWLVDPKKPQKFRDAGWFWGIAPGNPPDVVKNRLAEIEQTLKRAQSRAFEAGGKLVLDTRDFDKQVKAQLVSKGASTLDEHKSKIFLDAKDIMRCIEFHQTLKQRFQKELEVMMKDK